MKKTYILLLLIILLIVTIILLLNKNKNTNSFNNNYFFYKEYNKTRYLLFKEKNKLSDKDAIILVNIGLDQDFYTNTKETTKLNSNYILVNKYNYLPNNYIPNNLKEIVEYSKSNIQLVQEARESFIKMAKDITLSNLQIRAISAYRSYEYQKNLYNKYLLKDSQKIVDTYSARPGYSEHQTGLAVDIDNYQVSYNNFGNTKEFIWLQQNAYKYGFILRYPKNKENITGYQYEPWHYRYVGIEISTYIQKNNITYDEYYHEFIDI